MWQRWNGTSHIFEKSDDNGSSWAPLPLSAATITEGILSASRLPAVVARTDVANTFAVGPTTFTDWIQINRGGSPFILFLEGGASKARVGFSTGSIVFGDTQGVTLLSINAVTGAINSPVFAQHVFAAPGVGEQSIRIQNSSAGAGNYTALWIGNNTSQTQFGLFGYSSIYGSSGASVADGLQLYSGGAGGISIAAQNGVGVIRFYAQGATRIAQISNAGYSQVAWITTGAAANAFIADNDIIQRSTSSLRYKKDVVTLDGERAKAIVAALHPITYRGINNGETRFPGFAAEEVAELEPMLVTYDKDGQPDYVMYDRIASYLIPVIQDQEARIKSLEARLNNGK